MKFTSLLSPSYIVKKNTDDRFFLGLIVIFRVTLPLYFLTNKPMKTEVI
jgi:hypothetical protein